MLAEFWEECPIIGFPDSCRTLTMMIPNVIFMLNRHVLRALLKRASGGLWVTVWRHEEWRAGIPSVPDKYYNHNGLLEIM